MFGIRILHALALSAGLSITSTATAQSLVNFGDVITEPGVYVLNGNQSGTGNGISIRTSDVTLFLLRFTLRGGGTDEGIRVDAYENVTVWGGRVTEFDTGIHFQESRHCTVRDTQMDHNSGHGLELDDVEYCAFLRLRANDNDDNGVDAANCSHNRFFNLRCDGNYQNGMRLAVVIDVAVLGAEASDNRITKCWFAYNQFDGLLLEGADSNDIKENQAVANGFIGIDLNLAEDEEDASLGNSSGSDDNRVARNWCPFNVGGIVAERGSVGNEIHDNIALASSEVDLYDGNDGPPCENTWFLNLFLTRGGDGALCIF